MIINVNGSRYKVNWAERGWTYAVPVVKVKKKMRLINISYWCKVWEGEAKSKTRAEMAHPKEIKAWFEDAVQHYEEYKARWDRR